MTRIEPTGSHDQPVRPTGKQCRSCGTEVQSQVQLALTGTVGGGSRPTRQKIRVACTCLAVDRTGDLTSVTQTSAVIAELLDGLDVEDVVYDEAVVVDDRSPDER